MKTKATTLAYKKQYAGYTGIYSEQTVAPERLFRPFEDMGENNITSFRAYAEQQAAFGMPITLVYRTGNAVVQDVSDSIMTTPYIKVTPGGYIRVQSTSGAVPKTNVTFQIKTDPTI